MRRAAGWREVDTGQTQAEFEAGFVGVDDPAGQARQALFSAHAGGELLPVERDGAGAGAVKLLGTPRAAAGDRLPGHVTRGVGRLVMTQAGEVVAPFAPPKVMKLVALDRIKPSAAEVSANPRSRSAIMRVAERTEA